MTNSGCFDQGYFAERIERNRALAARATNPRIRALHLHYVRLYAQLLDEALAA
ncbi:MULTISPECIES: hypothetical protein [unclassified Sphingobium]|uniref:hypothetical protein n=1 Tax=unclassified Sphingobium TaxID=2611147 RepID=UPI0035A59B9A